LKKIDQEEEGGKIRPRLTKPQGTGRQNNQKKKADELTIFELGHQPSSNGRGSRRVRSGTWSAGWLGIVESDRRIPGLEGALWEAGTLEQTAPQGQSRTALHRSSNNSERETSDRGGTAIGG